MTTQPGSPLHAALWGAIRAWRETGRNLPSRVMEDLEARDAIDRAIAALCEEAGKVAVPADVHEAAEYWRAGGQSHSDAGKMARFILSLPHAKPAADGEDESPVCRLQLPDGSVPTGNSAAAECWHLEAMRFWRERDALQAELDALKSKPAPDHIVDANKMVLAADGAAALRELREWASSRYCGQVDANTRDSVLVEIDRRIAAAPPSEAQQAGTPDEIARLKREMAHLVDMFERLEGELEVERDEHSALEGLVDAAQRLKVERDAALARAAGELQAVSGKINTTHPSWKYVATFVAGRLNAIAVREAMPPIPLDAERVKATVARAKSIADVTVTDVLIYDAEQEAKAGEDYEVERSLRCLSQCVDEMCDANVSKVFQGGVARAMRDMLKSFPGLWRESSERDLARERLAGGATGAEGEG